jgi:putative oxidoreductase
MFLTNPFLHFLDRSYGLLIQLGSNLQSLFLLYMRLTWGHKLFIIGLAKLNNIQHVVEFFTSLNLPHPLFTAYLVASFETVGGLLLFLGLASRLAAIPVTCIMLVALSTAHAANISNFRFLTQPDLLLAQAPYPYLLTAVIIFIFGPGRISIDGWIKRWIDRQPRY